MKQTMDNITNVSPEILWDDSNIKWTVKYETIYPEVLDMPSYNYGNWQNTLDAWLALRNLSTWWGKYYTWFIQLSSAWTFTISWVWFTPIMIKFDVIWTWISWGSWFNWNNRCIAYYSWGTLDYSNSRCFRMDSTNWLWDVASVNSNWFILNYNWWTTANIQYQCFW
jgi:hypothetical protein